MRRDSIPRGEGERQETARRRKRLTIFAALAFVGFVPGLYLGYNDGAALDEIRSGHWPPVLVIVLSGLYLLGMLASGLLLRGVTDEVERQNSYKAASFAGWALMLVYPIWFLLWRGGLVPEPIHWVLFAVFWLSLLLASLWYRFR
jgi:hypothetical protein